MAFLELEGSVHELPVGETMVGGGAQAAWRIASHDLAAKHFVVTVGTEGSADVRPCSPQNVLVLNGRQVPSDGMRLRSGDVIAAGTARFYFLEQGDSRPAREEQSEATDTSAQLIDEDARGAYPLSHHTTTIGRDISSVIRLKDPRVSRFHADIRIEAGTYVLYPMGASGTQVNGERATAPHVLVEGDRISIAGASFRFTRRPLPSDVHPADSELELDDPQATRATLLHAVATTGERPAADRPSRLWLLAAAAIGLAIIGYIVFV